MSFELSTSVWPPSWRIPASKETRVRVEDACRGLGSCLGDLESRAFELAQGLKETAAEFSELAQALRDNDTPRLDEFARRMGRTQPVELPS